MAALLVSVRSKSFDQSVRPLAQSLPIFRRLVEALTLLIDSLKKFLNSIPVRDVVANYLLAPRPLVIALPGDSLGRLVQQSDLLIQIRLTRL